MVYEICGDVCVKHVMILPITIPTLSLNPLLVLIVDLTFLPIDMKLWAIHFFPKLHVTLKDIFLLKVL